MTLTVAPGRHQTLPLIRHVETFLDLDGHELMDKMKPDDLDLADFGILEVGPSGKWSPSHQSNSYEPPVSISRLHL